MELNYILAFASALVIGYLLGSIAFAVVISKFFFGKDIRKLGSGNAGMSNMMRNFGKKAGIATFIGDVVKGMGAVVISSQLAYQLFEQSDFMVMLVGYVGAFAAVLGHLFPIYYGFKGGKGVATGLGCMLGVYLPLAPILLIVFFIAFKTSRMFSVGSIVAALFAPVGLLAIKLSGLADLYALDIILTAALAAIIILMHHQNIRRILEGTETRYARK